jgi:Fe2+ or Zn2+ uptake regulation protein
MRLKLTSIRLRILRHLATYNEAKHGCPTASEIADALECPRPDPVFQPLRAMADAGLVEVAGFVGLKGKMWRITKAGRRTLARLTDSPL